MFHRKFIKLAEATPLSTSRTRTPWISSSASSLWVTCCWGAWTGHSEWGSLKVISFVLSKSVMYWIFCRRENVRSGHQCGCQLWRGRDGAHQDDRLRSRCDLPTMRRRSPSWTLRSHRPRTGPHRCWRPHRDPGVQDIPPQMTSSCLTQEAYCRCCASYPTTFAFATRSWSYKHACFAEWDYFCYSVQGTGANR